jgi:hypothetical protein
MGLIINENVAVISGEILYIISVILIVNGEIKNPIELIRELLVSKTDKLLERDREIRKKNIKRKIASAFDPAEIEIRDVFKNYDFRP